MTSRLFLARHAFSTVAAVLGIAAALLNVSAVQAQSFTFSLTPAQKPGMLGETIVFQGILANNTSNTIFITGLNNDFDIGVFGDYAQSPAVPFSLAPNATYTGNVFSVRIDSTTTPNSAGGTVTVQGGATEGALTELAEVNYNISVGTVVLPETNTLSLIALALPVVGGAVVHHRRRKNPS